MYSHSASLIAWNAAPSRFASEKSATRTPPNFGQSFVCLSTRIDHQEILILLYLPSDERLRAKTRLVLDCVCCDRGYACGSHRSQFQWQWFRSAYISGSRSLADLLYRSDCAAERSRAVRCSRFGLRTRTTGTAAIVPAPSSF